MLKSIKAIRRSDACRARTKLIVFLGTPHRGSAYAGWGDIASNFARLVGQDLNKQIIKTLEVSSEVLDNIHEEFKTIVDQSRIKIHSFQEARGISDMKGLRNKVSCQIVMNVLPTHCSNDDMTAGCRRFLLKARFATIPRDCREHRCESHADGEM